MNVIYWDAEVACAGCGKLGHCQVKLAALNTQVHSPPVEWASDYGRGDYWRCPECAEAHVAYLATVPTFDEALREIHPLPKAAT